MAASLAQSPSATSTGPERARLLAAAALVLVATKSSGPWNGPLASGQWTVSVTALQVHPSLLVGPARGYTLVAGVVAIVLAVGF